MSQLALSILIPTTPDRREQVTVLFEKLKDRKAHKEVILNLENCTWHCAQRMSGEVEILICEDDKIMPIGAKRETMYQKASGEYSCQIDSDDDIAPNAIELILEAIKQNPDCITFREHCMMDGKEYKSNHSLEYADWEGDGSRILEDGFHFHRTPFMKSVIKTEIARSVPIPHIRYGEDHQWAQALKPHLKTEVHIPEDIYFYQHQSSDPTERYGLDK